MGRNGGDDGLRWSLEQRLALVAARLNWEGRVNRADLVRRFGISPNQATADLQRFAALHPGGLSYDTRAKTYVAGPGWPGPGAAETNALLRNLRLVAEGVMPGDDAVLSAAPSVDTVGVPMRATSPSVLACVLRAIQTRQAIQARYLSLSNPRPTQRRLEPHALVFDGFRWHARARDVREDVFKHFALARLSGCKATGAAERSVTLDTDWSRRVKLCIAPHPGLSAAQRRVVEADYGMVDGQLTYAPRAALVCYLKRRLGLDRTHLDRSPAEQQIVLLSERDIAS